MTLNPNIDASGVAALVAAGKIDPLIAQLIQARIKADDARAALVAFNNAQNVKSVNATVAANRAAGRTGREASSDYAEIGAAATAQAAKVEEARRDQILRTGNANQVAALRQGDYNDAVKEFGKNSPQAIKAQTELLELQEKDAKAGKKGKSGGATKLTDQQRLNNTLLADQESYDQKREALATQHAIDVEKINADFAKKELAQEKANQIAQLNSQADFYDRLTSSDLNKKSKSKGGDKQNKAALAAIDADYQQSLAKVQELQNQGQAKLGADYLALKQRQEEQELDYQEKVAAARDKKDKSEVDRLQQVQAIRERANDEEERQLLEGGDANVNARDQALADANAKELDAQDKLATAAEQSNERKVNAAIRNQKAVQAENVELAKQAGLYAQLPAGRGADVTAVAGTPTAPGMPTAPTQVAPSAPSKGDLLQVNDVAVVNALAAMHAMQSGKFDMIIGRLAAMEGVNRDIASAVRGLSGQLVNG